MKLTPIQKVNLLAAADEIDQTGKEFWSDYFVFIPERNGEYPFKELVRRALSHATGHEYEKNYFKSNDSYRNYISKTFGYPIIFKVRDNIPFFTVEEIEYFASFAESSYESENPEHQARGEWMKRTMIAKTETWARALNLEGFEVEPDRNWQRYQKMIPYTWDRIYRKGDKGKKLFFTVGVDSNEMALVYKLHGYFESQNPTNAFTEHEKAIYERMVEDTPARWVQIDADQLEQYTWEILISETTRFIEQYSYLYDDVLYAFQQVVLPSATDTQRSEAPPINALNEKPIPKGIGTLPVWKKIETGQDIDYEMDYKHKKTIGDVGERLVIALEQAKLKQSNRPELAKKVRKAKDWEGFDIQSYYLDGRNKLIEVKTTEGPETRPFYWTKNEKHTMINNSESYCLYRLFNYDNQSNTADFFVLEGNILGKILLSEESYKVYIK